MSRTDEEDKKTVGDAVMRLMEHFDSIQIIATRVQGDETRCIAKGDGNWYARIASAEDWLEQQRERLREDTRRNFSE